ncbi:hypothetical protein PanWU01x14_004780, partial [Parasponia andersonii]
SRLPRKTKIKKKKLQQRETCFSSPPPPICFHHTISTTLTPIIGGCYPLLPATYQPPQASNATAARITKCSDLTPTSQHFHLEDFCTYTIVEKVIQLCCLQILYFYQESRLPIEEFPSIMLVISWFAKVLTRRSRVLEPRENDEEYE